MNMQDFPFFFSEDFPESGVTDLPEESARHAVQVLRMKEGERIHLTDGKGRLAVGRIITSSRKIVSVEIETISRVDPPFSKLTIAVSLLKNASRFEWFLEKAAELGVYQVLPLLCGRTERQHFRLHRFQNILVSAMLQSKQSRMPLLSEPLKFDDFLATPLPAERLIAWCGPGEKQEMLCGLTRDTVVCIGPEGDFTPAEIESALSAGFKGVSLGVTRLRTETAALTAAVMLTR